MIAEACAMQICTRCAAHVADDRAACPACGQSAEAAAARAPAIQPEPDLPPADDAEEHGRGQIPRRLAWRLRLLDVRAFPSLEKVKAVFMAAAVVSAAAGAVAIVFGAASGSAVGPGCMLIIEAPLIGLFCVVAFVVGAAVWQLLSNTVLFAVDPKRREAVRTLQRIGHGGWDDERPNDEVEAQCDDRVTGPADGPDDRIVP